MERASFVKVAVRARPLLDQEKSSGQSTCLQFTDNNNIIVAYERGFGFNYAFDESTTQEELYRRCGMEYVQNVLAGYNSTIIAYGQTGSGKTFTMGTGHQPTLRNSSWENAGIIPRAVADIFSEIEKTESAFEVGISFFEIYKEDVFDLMSENRTKIKLRDQGNSVILTNLTEIAVSCVEEALECLEKGARQRTTGATALNICSSRSHTIYTIHLRETKNNGERKISNFHLVDLAGSEMVKKTKAEGERFREGVTINLSLMKLMHVITSRAKNSSHIPYRDSTLTQVLKDSLNGKGKMLMIACVSPSPLHLPETVTTLKYANEASQLKGKQQASFKLSRTENNPFRNELDMVPPTPANRKDRLYSMPTPSNRSTPCGVMNSTINDPSSAAKDRLLMPPPLLSFDGLSPLCSTLHERTNYVNDGVPLRLSTIHDRTSCINDDDLKGLISPLAKKVHGMVENSMNQTLITLGNKLLRTLKRRMSERPAVDTSPFPGIKLARGNDTTFFPSPFQCGTNLQSRNSTVNDAFDCTCTKENSENSSGHSITIIRQTQHKERNQAAVTNPQTDSLDEFNVGSTKATNKRSYHLRTRGRKENVTPDCCTGAVKGQKLPKHPANKRLMEKQRKFVLMVLNAGNAKQLQGLPVIGPKSAQIIFTWRSVYGPFKNMNDLKEVKGLQKSFFTRFLDANLLL